MKKINRIKKPKIVITMINENDKFGRDKDEWHILSSFKKSLWQILTLMEFATLSEEGVKKKKK